MSMRIGGIASGFDTEQMLVDMMRVERMKVDKLFRQEEALKWQKDALNTTNKTLADFILKARSDFGLTTTTSTGTVLKNSAQNLDWVKKVSSSDDSVLDGVATSTAQEGTYTVKVESLAETASVMSKKLYEAGGSNNIVDSKGNFDLTKLGGSKDLEINGKTYTIGEGNIKTMDALVKEINKDSNLTAAYDKKSGYLMVNTKEQGLDQQINIEGDLAGDIFGGSKSVTGKNAKIDFNGNTIEQSSNNFSLFGVDYNLKSTGTTTVKVEANIDGMYDKVKGFVDDYNALIDKLNELTNEKSYRDYRPLTKDEREAMKDKEIELWEEKARSGLLKNDPTINKMLQSMRSSLYEKVETGGKFNHLTQIGISTGNYQSGGKLEINEEKLKQALRDDAEGVMDLLFKNPTSKDSKDGGLVNKVFDDMVVGMKDIIRRSGAGEHASTLRNVQSNILVDFVTKGSISLMDRDLNNINKRMIDEEAKLAKKEQRYWAQFTAMEKTLEKMNSQSGWLSAQLGQF